MAVNKQRGEVPVELDGRQYRLRLTLGALAELEAAYEADDLGALVERFSRGRLSAGDLIRVLGAGLRGAGHDIADDAVARMAAAGGAAALVKAVAGVLTATFGTTTGDPANP